MSISRVKTWISGEVLTASDLNAEVNNILNNPVDLWSPAAKAADMNGFELILDADGDTSITADTNDQVDFKVGGFDELVLTGAALYPATSDGLQLGSTTKMWSDIFLASGAVINFNNGNYTITHSAGALTFSGNLGVRGADPTGWAARIAADGSSVSPVQIYDPRAQTAGRGARIELGASSDDGASVFTSYAALQGKKANSTSGNLEGVAVIQVNNGTSLTDAITVSAALATTLAGALTVNGVITRTGAAATPAEGLALGGTTTAYHHATISNTGGNLRIGVDNSAGTGLISYGTAYGSVVGTNNATDLNLFANGATVLRLVSNGAHDRYLTVTGGVSGSGTNATINVSGGGLTITPTITASSLAGTGTRAVVVDANGVMSAP